MSINYDGWGSGPGPRKRRGGRLIAVAAVVCVAAAALLAGRAILSHSSPSAASPGSGSQSGLPVTQPGELSLGACIDPTLSLVPSFAPDMRQYLSQAVAGLAPASGKPATGAANPGQSAVDLTIRQVDTTSFSSAMTQFTRNVQVPGVPGLTGGRPALTDPSFNSDLRNWSQGYQEVVAAQHTAANAAASAAQSVADLPLDANAASSSGISACVSALLETAPPAGTHSYLLASDLEENVPPQLAGSFHGAPLVIIQACDSGDATYCQGLETTFVREMKRLDVGPVTVERPEVASQVIRQWIRTGEVTP